MVAQFELAKLGVKPGLIPGHSTVSLDSRRGPDPVDGDVFVVSLPPSGK